MIAAANHLNAANDTLRPIAGADFDRFVGEINRVYRKLAPSDELVVPKLRGVIIRHLWPRKIVRLLGWLIIFGFFAGVGYAAWKIWPMLEF